MKKNCNVISLSDYFEKKFDNKKINVAITFDDGYTNNLTEALPLLKKYNFRAVIYLLAHNDIPDNHWDAGEIPAQALMNSKERQILFQSD